MVLAEEMAAKGVLRKRFEQEIRAATRLEHPNVVATLDHGDSDAGPYLVMEYVKGESLGARIERNGPMAPAEAVRLISDVARALDYAHQQGVIHRDVKPDNILITSDGQARLADFGLVKLVDDDADLTRPGTGLGTPSFMPPEQLTQAKAIDLRCDIYGLGATLYMAVTGRLPFSARTLLQMFKLKSCNQYVPPRKLAPSLSKRLERTICRAMSPERDERQASCAAFLRELAECAGTNSAAPPAQGASAETRAELSDVCPSTATGLMVGTRPGATQRTDLIGVARDTKPSMDPKSSGGGRVGKLAPSARRPRPSARPAPPAPDTKPAMDAPARTGRGWRFALAVVAAFGIAFGASLALCGHILLK